MTEQRTCKVCLSTYPLTKDFFGHTKSGFRHQCRKCINARSKAHAQANPDMVRARSARYQAKKNRWAPTEELKAQLVKEQAGLCVCCGEKLAGDLDVDHLTPVAQGGTNDESNLVIVHRKCNQEKSSKTFVEYLAWRKRVGLDWPELTTEKVLAHVCAASA